MLIVFSFKSYLIFLNIKNNIMSALTDKIRGNWKMIKGKLKEEYGQLTDDDLTYREGQEEQLLGRLQTKLGKSKEEIKKFIDNV